MSLQMAAASASASGFDQCPDARKTHCNILGIFDNASRDGVQQRVEVQVHETFEADHIVFLRKKDRNNDTEEAAEAKYNP